MLSLINLFKGKNGTSDLAPINCANFSSESLLELPYANSSTNLMSIHFSSLVLRKKIQTSAEMGLRPNLRIVSSSLLIQRGDCSVPPRAFIRRQA